VKQIIIIIIVIIIDYFSVVKINATFIINYLLRWQRLFASYTDRHPRS